MLEDNVDFGLGNKNVSSISKEPTVLAQRSWFLVKCLLHTGVQWAMHTHWAAQLSPMHPIGNETEPSAWPREAYTLNP